jgi:hypothetical protein
MGPRPLRMVAAAGTDLRCLDEPDFKMPASAMRRLLEASARAAQVDRAAGAAVNHTKARFRMLALLKQGLPHPSDKH